MAINSGGSSGLSAIKSNVSTITGNIASIEQDMMAISEIAQSEVIRGTATDGLNGFLEDTTKTWFDDQFIDKTIKITKDNISYYPLITSNTTNRVYFTPIDLPTGATLVLGSGDAPQGQVELTLIGELSGSVGNEYSIEVVNGDTDTGLDYIALDSENKLFTITVDTNVSGQTREFMAGTIESLLENNLDIAEVLGFNQEFIPGSIPATGNPLPFTGGNDGIRISAGDTYEIAFSYVIDTLESRVNQLIEEGTYVTSIDSIPSFVGQEALVGGVWYKSVGISSIDDWVPISVNV